MNEKRFSIKEGSSIGLSSIYTDNGKVMTQLEVLDVLIKQHETIQSLKKENGQLKQEIGNLRDFRGFITEKNVFNEKERKKLQLQLLRLYNYFENYFEDEMSSNAFSEMWDNVKEDEKWEKK